MDLVGDMDQGLESGNSQAPHLAFEDLSTTYFHFETESARSYLVAVPNDSCGYEGLDAYPSDPWEVHYQGVRPEHMGLAAESEQMHLLLGSVVMHSCLGYQDEDRLCSECVSANVANYYTHSMLVAAMDCAGEHCVD